MLSVIKAEVIARTPEKEKDNKDSHILVIYVNHYQKTIHETTIIDAVAEEAANDYNFFENRSYTRKG